VCEKENTCNNAKQPIATLAFVSANFVFIGARRRSLFGREKRELLLRDNHSLSLFTL